MMRFVRALAVSSLLATGCTCGQSAPPNPTVKAAPSAAPPSAPKEPPTPSSDVSFETADKIPLAGTLLLAKDETSPVLVLVHRFRGDRQEWAPLVSRLAQTDKRYTVVNFDLRGHGASKSASGKKVLDWANMKPKDMPNFVEDVRAAIAFGVGKENGKARGVVVVGSSLGAAFAARAASEEPKVVAVGLVSPGAAIEGFDVYHPFADVRMLPSFIAGAKDDNVSRDPVASLSQMAKEFGTVKTYDGKGHGVFGLAQEGDAIWNDLVDWLSSVYDAAPKERELFSPKPEKAKR